MLENYNIHDRQSITLHCVITLCSNLSHIGKVIGNVSNLRTLPVIGFDGIPRQVFVYSGNALRNGILRRVGISGALEDLGLQVNPDCHHTLFAGGRIDSSTSNNMELDTRMRQLMPWLSVLGTAKPAGVFGEKKSQMMQGRSAIGSAYLVCYEAAEYIYGQFPGALPPESHESLGRLIEAKQKLLSDPFTPVAAELLAEWIQVKEDYLPLIQRQLRASTEYLVIDQTIRRDSTHDPSLQQFLSAPCSQLSAGQATLFDTPSNEKSRESKEKASNQMIASDRLIMSNSKLYSRWDFNATKVEVGWVVDTMLRFAKHPYLGGKHNRGNGLAKIDFWYTRGDKNGHWLSLSTNATSMSATAQESHTAYREYLEDYKIFLDATKDNAGKLRELLSGAK